MIKKSLLTIITLTIFLANSYCQTKKIKTKDPILKNSWEEYSVLKSDKSIREGEYLRVINGKTSIEGTYKNGQKASKWKFYNYNGKVELEIDYSSGEVKYLTTDTLTKTEITVESNLNPNNDRPVLNISSSYLILSYLMQHLKFPQSAREEGISGKVIIAIKINAKGKIYDYVVNTSVDKSLDEEALRVIKLIPLEFLPAYKNGIPIDSEIQIPVRFKFQ